MRTIAFTRICASAVEVDVAYADAAVRSVGISTQTGCAYCTSKLQTVRSHLVAGCMHTVLIASWSHAAHELSVVRAEVEVEKAHGTPPFLTVVKDVTNDPLYSAEHISTT